MRARATSRACGALLALLAAACLAVPASGQKAAAHEDPIRSVVWLPDQLQQGSPVLFQVELTAPATRVSATWQGRRLRFFRGDKPRVWIALAAVDMDAQPGNLDLHVAAPLRTGRLARATKSVAIAAANFGEGAANVAEQYVEPAPDQQKQIARDELVKKQAFAHDTPQPLWSGDFVKPVDADSTPSFGETRLLNEEKTSRHTGTDFPIREGATVRAANSGTVVLARQLFYEGNCVILSHGDRFFTVYMHLSRIDVRVGERLRKGAPLGLSGSTGRVTGPHLHFAAQWDGLWVDPVALLSLTLPDLRDHPR